MPQVKRQCVDCNAWFSPQDGAEPDSDLCPECEYIASLPSMSASRRQALEALDRRD